jgi:hypothetical protein
MYLYDFGVINIMILKLLKIKKSQVCQGNEDVGKKQEYCHIIFSLKEL